MLQHTPLTVQDQGAAGYVILDGNGNFYARTCTRGARLAPRAQGPARRYAPMHTPYPIDSACNAASRASAQIVSRAATHRHVRTQRRRALTRRLPRAVTFGAARCHFGGCDSA